MHLKLIELDIWVVLLSDKTDYVSNWLPSLLFVNSISLEGFGGLQEFIDFCAFKSGSPKKRFYDFNILEFYYWLGMFIVTSNYWLDLLWIVKESITLI